MSRKHKDLNRTHALLEGEGWHIINTNQRTTNRKDRRRCIHYDKTFKNCNLNCICLGASDCPCYRER